MYLAFLVLLSCGTEISIQVETAECTDYDFDDPEAESFEVTEVDGDWHVSHKGVFEGCADVFDPEISGKGRAITVREYWEARTEDDCTICYAPTIVLEQPPPGNYEVGWYEGEGASALEVIEFEVE
jgi:hypothetical protein